MPLPGSDFEIFRYANPTPPDSSPRSIAIQSASSWSYIGAPLSTDSLPSTFHTWSEGTFVSGDIIHLLAPLLTFIHNFMRDTPMTHYCLTIRAQKSNTEFDIPRWHVDRRFFDAEGTISSDIAAGTLQQGAWKPSNWKLAAALLGPGTIFLKDGKRGRQLQREIESRLQLSRKDKGLYTVGEGHMCTSFRCLGCAEMGHTLRLELATAIMKTRLETRWVENGEVVVFRVDGYGTCGGEPAMHTEPPMSEGDRVFVHVVPGREKELRRLAQDWEMDFPRDWCVGVLQDLKN